MTISRRTLMLAGALALACATGVQAQSDFPARAIKMIVPFPAGGGTDNMARLLSAGLSELKGWSVVIENKPGAGGNLALDQTARSAPDGLTLVLAQTDNVVLNPLLYSKLSYDPDKDLRAVALVAAGPAVLVVREDSPFQTLQDIAKAAKEKPRELTFASPGTGTVAHLISEAWQKSAGIEFTHIPFRGMAQAMPDLLGGRVNMYMGSIPTLLSHIQSGKVRAIAVTTAQRSSLLPDVPTYTESGVEGVELASVWGVMAPASTPDGIVNQLNAAINEVVQQPEYSKKILGYGAELMTGTPQDMAELYTRDRNRLAPIVESSGTTLD